MPLDSSSNNHHPNQLPAGEQSHQLVPKNRQNSSSLAKESSGISKVNTSALNHDSNAYSPAVLNLLEQPPASFPLRFMVGGLVFCLALAGWAWFGHVEEVARAQGKLVPQGRTYKIEPARNGKIEQLLIEEGDTVVAGEVLARLDGEELSQKINQLEQRLESYRNQLYQQQNLLLVKQSEALNRQEIASADLTGQEIAIAKVQEQVTDKQEQLAALQLEVRQNQQRLERLQPLQQKGAISQEYVFQAQQTLQDSQVRLLQFQSEMKAAKKEAEQLKVGLAQKKQEKTRTQLETQQQIQQLEISIEQLQGTIAETQNELAMARSQQKETVLESPVDGTVLSLNLQNIGQVLQPGQTVAEIAPQGTPLVLDAAIPNHEAGLVEKNMEVKIKLDAYPYEDYGIVSGKVISISPNSITNEQGTFYKIEVALDHNYIEHKQQKIDFQVGQTAKVEIITRRRRIAEVIFEPIQKLREGGLNF